MVLLIAFPTGIISAVKRNSVERHAEPRLFPVGHLHAKLSGWHCCSSPSSPSDWVGFRLAAMSRLIEGIRSLAASRLILPALIDRGGAGVGIVAHGSRQYAGCAEQRLYSNGARQGAARTVDCPGACAAQFPDGAYDNYRYAGRLSDGRRNHRRGHLLLSRVWGDCFLKLASTRTTRWCRAWRWFPRSPSSSLTFWLTFLYMLIDPRIRDAQ